MVITMRLSRSLLPVLASFAWSACGSSGTTEPEPRPPADLNIIQLPANHPPFESRTVSFWARKNQTREGAIYFLNTEGQRGEAFARLKIDSGSLLARPDGTPFGTSDSVLITMTVVEPSQILVELQPSGLTFVAGKPAELKLDYGATEGDLNEDGKVDGKDNEIQQQMAIWRQEKLGDPFVQIGSVKAEDLREIEAKLVSFSRYAIAY
jgi:hypothetical protein